MGCVNNSDEALRLLKDWGSSAFRGASPEWAKLTVLSKKSRSPDEKMKRFSELPRLIEGLSVRFMVWLGRH
eukprot:6343643-Amphidinium_carterae.1